MKKIFQAQDMKCHIIGFFIRLSFYYCSLMDENFHNKDNNCINYDRIENYKESIKGQISNILESKNLKNYNKEEPRKEFIISSMKKLIDKNIKLLLNRLKKIWQCKYLKNLKKNKEIIEKQIKYCENLKEVINNKNIMDIIENKTIKYHYIIDNINKILNEFHYFENFFITLIFEIKKSMHCNDKIESCSNYIIYLHSKFDEIQRIFNARNQEKIFFSNTQENLIQEDFNMQMMKNGFNILNLSSKIEKKSHISIQNNDFTDNKKKSLEYDKITNQNFKYKDYNHNIKRNKINRVNRKSKYRNFNENKCLDTIFEGLEIDDENEYNDKILNLKQKFEHDIKNIFLF